MREHEIGKVVNNRLVTPTDREYKGVVVANPTNAQLKFLRGYVDIDKEQVASAEAPEYNGTTHIVNEVYFINEETKKINKRYDIIELPTYIAEEDDIAENQTEVNE